MDRDLFFHYIITIITGQDMKDLSWENRRFWSPSSQHHQQQTESEAAWSSSSDSTCPNRFLRRCSCN